MPLDAEIINDAIRLAVAPVFLLTAVAGLLGAVVGRLARIIDRARDLETQLEHPERSAMTEAGQRRAVAELATLRRRGQLANASIALLTLCAFAIGLAIILLFLAETSAMRVGISVMVSFVGGVLCYLCALLCFFIETVLATRVLRFRALQARRTP